MTDRYPHAPTCAKMHASTLHWDCTCGATALQSAFEAGKREADARAMAVVTATIEAVRRAGWCELCRVNSEHPHRESCPLVTGGFIDRNGERRG